MKRPFFFSYTFAVAVLALFSACSNVHFESPVPSEGKTLAVFPKNLQGIYQGEDGEILTVYKDRFTHSGMDTDEPFFISDSLVFKKWNDFYYLNLKSDDHWIAMQIEQKKGEILMREIDIEESMVPEIEAITPILENKMDEENGEDFILINPDQKAFERLLVLNFFSEPIVFKPIAKE